MNNLFNFILSINYVFINALLLSELFGYDLLEIVKNKIRCFTKFNNEISKNILLISLIFIHFIGYSYIHNHARLNLIISMIILMISGSIAFFLSRRSRNIELFIKFKYIFFITSIFILTSNIFLYPEIFSIGKSGNFNVLSLLVIGAISTLSGLLISINFFFNFLKIKFKKQKSKKIYNKILLITTANLIILLLFTEASFICDILFIVGILLGLNMTKNLINIDRKKINNTLTFLLFILLCLVSVFIENLFLTMVSAMISGVMLNNYKEDIKNILLEQYQTVGE